VYPAFSVISVPEGHRGEIEGVAHSAGVLATPHDEWDSLFMPGGTVDTRSLLPSALSGYPEAEGLYVIQFEAPLDAAWAGEVEKVGLRYISYIPYNAVLVYGSQEAVARLAAKTEVQWASLYEPAFRAQPADLASVDRSDRYVIQFVATP